MRNFALITARARLVLLLLVTLTAVACGSEVRT